MATTEVRIMVAITTVATATIGGIISPLFFCNDPAVHNVIHLYV